MKGFIGIKVWEDGKLKMKKIIYSAVFIMILTGTDQVIKQLVVRFLKGGDSVPLIKDILELEYYENSGAAFNFLVGKTNFLIILTGVVIAFLIWKLVQTLEVRRYWGMSFCFCLLIGGAIGNLIDRVAKGYVVDFIYCEFLDFPKFNFADMCVSIGAVLMGLLLITYYCVADVDFLLSFKGYH